MKHKLGIKTILIKTSHERDLSLHVVLENMLMAKKILVEPGLAVYQLPDNITIELYSTGACYPSYLFAHGDMVIGYRVADLKLAVDQLLEQGQKLLGDVVSICTSNCYCFMLINGSQVIGLYQSSSALY